MTRSTKCDAEYLGKITPAGGGGPAGVIKAIGNREEECCQSIEAAMGGGVRCFEFCRAQARIFSGFPAAGDQSRRRPFGYHRGASMTWNIVGLNRFVQCNVHMEDMRIAQRGSPFAVPANGWRGSDGYCASERSTTFLPASSAKEPQAGRSKPGCRRAAGASIFPLIR